MALKIVIRVQVSDAAHSGEYDFEIPVNMPLVKVKTEILDLMVWEKTGLQWDLTVPCRKNALMEDTMENLLCWDDTVLNLRSRSVDNDMLPEDGHKVSGTTGYQHDVIH